MKLKRSPLRAWLIFLSILFSLCSGILLADHAQAESDSARRARDAHVSASQKDKVAPDIRERLKSGHGADHINVIVQSNGTWNGAHDALVQSFGAQKKQTFDNLNASLVELPVNAADALASLGKISYI